MRSSRRLLTSKYVKTLSLTLITFAAIFLFVIPGRTATSPFIISEFRLRGPNGASDEFIEIYNNTDKDHVVKASDGSSGSSGSVVVTLSGGGTTTVRGTTLEQPPTQVNGGGFNSSMSVSLGSPLKAGASIDLRFLFGVQQQGKFGFCAVIETLPFTNSAVTCYSGSTAPASARADDKGLRSN